jgi:predicted MPP superfamily phosphohydrolase
MLKHQLESKTESLLQWSSLVVPSLWSTHLQGHLQIRYERVEIPAKSLQTPVTLLHLSDLHLDWNTQAWLEALIPLLHTLCTRYEVDAIVFTGDAIAHSNHYLPALTEWFQALPTLPCFGVMGNHDYYEPSRGKDTRRAMEAAGVHMLVNESVQHYFSNTQGALTFHGIDDFIQGCPQAEGLIQKAAQHPEDNHLFLLHNPAQVAKPLNWGVFDVALAGHTHGGQFACPDWLAQVITESPYVKNWYRLNEYCQLFVHHATGTASIPCPIKFPWMKRKFPLSIPRWGLMSEVVIHQLLPTVSPTRLNQ